jgi:signal recognition particle subunit SRP54
MFENLTERLESAFKQIKGEGRITELNIAATVKDIRRALIDADVNYKIAKEFTDTIKEKAMGLKVLTAVSPGQLMVKIVKDELAGLMGGTESELNAKGNPAVILIAGLQGSGKTTFSGKLASYLKTKKGFSPLLVAADVYRPAAIEQLKVLGGQINVDVYSDPENKNVVQIALEAFNERLDFSGVVLTKLDGDTRGGAALSIKYTVNKPIKFVSSGEKLDTLDVFYPERMAQRILGMGDITTLVEKAQAQFNEAEALKLEKKIRKNQFDFEDFKQQLQQIKKMGNIKDLLGMIPGVGKAMKDIDISDDSFKGIEAIINSMTPYERANPDVIDQSRRKRLAGGSGKDINEINAFLKQFEQMKQMMKTMNKMPMGGRMGMNMGKK